MKNIDPPKITFIFLSLLALNLLTLGNLSAQPLATSETTVSSRPKQTDITSARLINNYLAVSGGKQAYANLKNVTATGTIIEGGKSKSFKLIETQDGRRHLTYKWKHLGRPYQTVYYTDGTRAWQQKLLPQKAKTQLLTGRDALHFIHQRWLIKPFALPLKADYVFKYQGMANVAGRPSYLISGYGKNNTRSWFYFDKEKYLLTRWGGKGTIAGIEENMDYRATRFSAANGVLIPQQIELIAENAQFGTITFDTITVNQTLDPKMFSVPSTSRPTLRQVVR
jgi:hypothetical protein